jgi:predicted SAM-dependent methyltransferase
MKIYELIRALQSKIKKEFRPVDGNKNLGRMTRDEMLKYLHSIPYWEDKINFSKKYYINHSDGFWYTTINFYANLPFSEEIISGYSKINYGCGGNIIPGWLNVDLSPANAMDYRQVNLLEKHPFQHDSISFGFSEDMLEHLSQAESIFFLSEVFRTLKNGGVMRLSFPGLEGVLNKHYTPITELRVREGELEAYTFWDHIHFYSREELRTVCKHIGFREVNFVEYGKSEYSELANRDTRSGQIGLNTYVELIK